MCESVWQPEEDGDETFCGKACVVRRRTMPSSPPIMLRETTKMRTSLCRRPSCCPSADELARLSSVLSSVMSKPLAECETAMLLRSCGRTDVIQLAPSLTT